MQNNEFIKIEPNIYLHIRDWGEGKPIVFIPGWPLSHEMYEYQFTQLPNHGYRCIGITLRGFGKSSKPWGDYNYAVFADDIKKVIEKLDLNDVTLAGHSMGGAIAIHYITRHKSERVSKLALFGAAAPSFTQKPNFHYGFKAKAVEDLIKLCYTDRAKLNEKFGKIFFLNSDAASPKMKEWFHNMGMEASPHATAACLKVLKDFDLRSDLSRVSVPTMIFHSVHDKICPIELAVELEAGIKSSKLIRFEKSGHGLFFEEKEKFNSELMNFVG